MIERFQGELDSYVTELEKFVQEHELPDRWFEDPDHVAIKCADSEDFEVTLAEFKDVSNQISYIEEGGRRLAAAHLLKPLAIGRFGSVEWVEVMEPRPGRVGNDFVGLEHAEFCYPIFTKARSVLRKAGVEHDLRHNPGHDWINIAINDTGQELKLNNRPLSKVMPDEIANEVAVEVKVRKVEWFDIALRKK